MLTAQGITVRYGDKTVVDGVSFSLREGEWLMLAGPNGAGKSTLVSALSQGAAYAGKIELDGRDLRAYKPSELARKVGVLSQGHEAGYAFTVEEIVSLGRYAYRGGFLSGRDKDGEKRINQALADTGMDAMRKKSVLTLSGGEMQRAFLAQVFAQSPQILLLDEPANHLDLIYQKHIFSLIRDWLSLPGRAVLSVVHDLSLAKRYGTDAILMSGGKAVAQGGINAVFTPENLDRVYGMDVYGWMRDSLKQWE
ncbi:MAG: ABC transporter ATP-binding protein [Eubacteriales bacterium]|nr:ABC transporter ATP-binding protein [Eubacteriales bacterium]MDD3881126.1 ABC transporter ATP-binding protein [Eubacteriales bacterium]MDD4511508.1 ABC transporter ATP-binding protein [Eubacteriales bacterium]